MQNNPRPDEIARERLDRSYREGVQPREARDEDPIIKALEAEFDRTFGTRDPRTPR